MSKGNRLSKEDRLFNIVITVLILLFTLSVLLPLINIIAASFSDPSAVISGKVLFWPVDFSLEGYKAVFRNKDIGTGYMNTIFYTVVGTIVNVTVTMFTGFAFSRKELVFRGPLMVLFTFTMFFGGGLIPTYINIRNLGLYDTAAVMIIPGMMSVYNMIIARTFIQNTLPNELYEAALIDGSDYFLYFFRIVLPLSTAVMAVLTLNYAVGHWNSYFNAMIYLRTRTKFPLQIFLREILVMNRVDDNMLLDPEVMQIRKGISDLLKYALIIVSSVPVLMLYPFVQKYFMKGVMIGSLKE
jgi:multiple sugar transport system permease protein/putative aldouronate transport system permease protein